MKLPSIVIVLATTVLSAGLFAQGAVDSPLLGELTVQKIMRDPSWIGHSPRRPYFSYDNKLLYFWWNPENADSDSLYVVSVKGGSPKKVSLDEQDSLPPATGDLNKARSRLLFSNDGDLFIYDIKKKSKRQLTNTNVRESNPSFSRDERSVIYKVGQNLFRRNLSDGYVEQLTDFKKGRDSKNNDQSLEYEQWVETEQLSLIQVLRERKNKKDRRVEAREAKPETIKRPLTIRTGSSRLQSQQLSADEQFITFVLADETNSKKTIVPQYVTESGFVDSRDSRTKVGRPDGSYKFGIYDISADSIYYLDTEQIPGIFDQPDYLKTDPPSDSTELADDTHTARNVYFRRIYYSDDGTRAALDITSLDHKDRWLMQLDLANGKLTLIDRQHDEAWIGGPGIRGWWGATVGWLPDNKTFWFQSEETGFSHLYTVDVTTGTKTALTSGEFELFSVKLSYDNRYWFIESNEIHPGERQLYRMKLSGGERTQITSESGRHRTTVSSGGKYVASLYSYFNRPADLFVMRTKAYAAAVRITTSISDEFLSYDWRVPEIVTFTARDSVDVYARIFRPREPGEHRPAVIFVHGAGYLQNAHKGWSRYYREYMFHNLLADNGYTVLDIDYRGSAGYGRDCRTAIYRHMGGKDLTDQVDGAKFLIHNYGVDSSSIGLYGGSYGGFITLMALFTEPDIFAAGAALRSVTDWAHYNHGYTSNILNTPILDSLAYVRSSPIYFAEGFKGALLMCHGMVDANVQFQDIVRLSQRLIELGKENWELAVYPVEAHSFREASSWTDEYSRIFKLFEDNLK